MIIQCDQCDRKFRVDDSKIKPPGSRVRCSKCGNVFFVEKKEATKQEESPAEQNVQDTKPPGLDDIKVGSSEAQQQADTGNIKIDMQEAAKTDSSSADFKDHTPVDSPLENKESEQVWSIDENEQTPSLDIEKPSEEPKIEVDSSEKTEVPQPPAEQQPDTEQAQPPEQDFSLSIDTKGTEQPETKTEDSSISWAALDSEPDDDSSKSVDNDLTPPIQQPENKEDDTIPPQPTPDPPQPEVTQTPTEDLSTNASEDSLTDPAQQVAQEPSLDLDLDKARQVDEQQAFQSSQNSGAETGSNISVDQNVASQVQAESYGGGIQDSGYEPSSTIKSSHRPQRKSFGSKVGSVITKIVVAACILVILTSVGLILAINLEILPKEKAKELRSFLVANLPVDIKDPLDGISVTSSQGQWINSSNGPLFVVRGNITNLTDNIINYIQLKAEYLNNGEILYNTKIYAGNTFTNQELQTLPLNDINERLNRKNGDIDFGDPRKLAGMNYNLMPGDSIEFYSIYPSNTQILGLKHNVEVIDAEIILVDNSG